MFTQLRVRDFRGFGDLALRDLNRVNLVVGRNNSGKTSLLEAIVTLCQPERLISGDLAGLFRTDGKGGNQRFQQWVVRDKTPRVTEITGQCESDADERRVWLARAGSPQINALQLEQSDLRASANPTLWAGATQSTRTISCRAVSAGERNHDTLLELFDRAMNRKGGEETIESLLQRVDPRLRRIRIRAPKDQEPYIEVDLGLSERIPLNQTGQGVSRLVAMFSELLGEKPEICLIDEIENGIHHSLLPQIWRGLGAAARELGVQIFATTHSHECILAAHETFAADAPHEFRIVQLFRPAPDRPTGVQGRVLDQSMIDAAIQGDVDLR